MEVLDKDFATLAISQNLRFLYDLYCANVIISDQLWCFDIRSSVIVYSILAFRIHTRAINCDQLSYLSSVKWKLLSQYLHQQLSMTVKSNEWYQRQSSLLRTSHIWPDLIHITRENHLKLYSLLLEEKCAGHKNCKLQHRLDDRARLDFCDWGTTLKLIVSFKI